MFLVRICFVGLYYSLPFVKVHQYPFLESALHTVRPYVIPDIYSLVGHLIPILRHRDQHS
jgi:hypothetical protein